MMSKSNAHPTEHSPNTGNTTKRPLHTNSWVPATTKKYPQHPPLPEKHKSPEKKS